MLSTLTSPLARPLVAAGTTAFRLASRLRGERAIHSRGSAVRGRLQVEGGAGTGVPLLDAPGGYDVVLRTSRSLGLPSPLPDVLGLAVRVLDAHGPDAHQDLLLDSAPSAPVLRHLPQPARDHLGAHYSSLVAHRTPRGRLFLGARALPGQPPATSVGELPLPFGLALLVATPHGPWQQVGVLRATDVLPAPEGRQLRFNPWTTGGGLQPPALLDRWRRQAYPATHVGPDA